MSKKKLPPCEHNPVTRCLACRAEAERERCRTKAKKAYEQNPEKFRAEKKAWYQKNKEKVAQYNKEHHAAHKAERSEYYKKRYANNPKYLEAKRRRSGLIWAEGQTFQTVLESQNHKCVICACDLRALPKRSVHVDHDHSITDRPNVRGILCNRCNQGLGLFKDNIQHLENAIACLRSNLTTPESC